MDTDVVDTDALRWFQQVADGMTVTQVGELYWVTQSGVSRGLARLEAEVGTPLLQRHGRVLRMTPAGAAFKRHVDALLNNLDDGLAAVSELVDPDTGTVTVAFQQSLATWLVPQLVSTFRAEHPRVRFILRQVRDELVSPVLDGGRTDLEITAWRRTDPTVTWQRLLTEPLRLAVAPDHRLAARAGDGDADGSAEPVDLADLRDEVFVALRPTSLLRRQAEELCRRAGFEPQVEFVGADLPTVRGFVAAGLGVAVVPAPHGGDPEDAGNPLRYLPIADPAAVREIGMAWSTERRLLPAADLFRQHVVATARSRRLPT